MSSLVLIFVFCFSNLLFAQVDNSTNKEFLPIHIEEKEAFMSTKTGEYIFMEHDTTDAEQLSTTEKGVVYVDISTHIVKKGESLYTIARKHNLTLNNLRIGKKLLLK
jgi:peptidoglycan endopeptidase LytF